MEDKIKKLIEILKKAKTEFELYIQRCQEELKPDYNMGLIQGRIESYDIIINELNKILKNDN